MSITGAAGPATISTGAAGPATINNRAAGPATINNRAAGPATIKPAKALLRNAILVAIAALTTTQAEINADLAAGRISQQEYAKED